MIHFYLFIFILYFYLHISDDVSVHSRRTPGKPNSELPPLSPPDSKRGYSESPNQHKSYAVVSKDRRVTSPAVLIGQSIDEDDENDDDDDDSINRIMNRPSEEIEARPVSAYVDLTQSYLPGGSRDSRDMSLHDNPMKSHVSPIRREKAVTVHTSKPDEIRTAPHRRPSPTDMKNLEEFKKGRTSKRATGKTQV